MEGTYVPKEKRKDREQEIEEVSGEKSMEEEEEDEDSTKKKSESHETDKTGKRQQEVERIVPQNNPPNKILFVQNLPEGLSELVLQTLFDKFTGFKEVRLAGGKNVAFVEYQNDVQATVAMSELQSFKIDDDHKLVISFQKQ